MTTEEVCMCGGGILYCVCVEGSVYCVCVEEGVCIVCGDYIHAFCMDGLGWEGYNYSFTSVLAHRTSPCLKNSLLSHGTIRAIHSLVPRPWSNPRRMVWCFQQYPNSLVGMHNSQTHYRRVAREN